MEALGEAVIPRDEHTEATLTGGSLDVEEQLEEELVFKPRKHHADLLGLLRPQGSRHPVGVVVELVHGLLHLGFGGGRDGACAREEAGNGGGGDACLEGDVG